MCLERIFGKLVFSIVFVFCFFVVALTDVCFDWPAYSTLQPCVEGAEPKDVAYKAERRKRKQKGRQRNIGRYADRREQTEDLKAQGLRLETEVWRLAAGGVLRPGVWRLVAGGVLALAAATTSSSYSRGFATISASG